jgi:hypothetical protein|tara:strand:+ start:183 stop:365 length:183 start_codon:yes stop_codon:yes gene_type:complete
MTYTSEEKEKDFLSDYVKSNPELYMADLIKERAAGAGERAMSGVEGDTILDKVQKGVIKV